MGVRKNMFAESGADSFHVDSTRERTPSGLTHRWQIRKLTVDEIRQQHRRTTKRLIERGMTKDEVVDELLGYGTEMVDDIDLVMMDREFDSDPV